MGYLKVIFYGLLAFVERNPIFCLFLLAIGIFAPFVFKWIGWVILAIIAIALLGIGVMALRFRKMKRQMEEQMRGAGGAGFGNMGSGFGNMGAGFGNMGGANGMSLEEFVRQMQAQADARKRSQQNTNTTSNTSSSTTTSAKKSSIDSSDYVDFEEVE